MIWAGLALGLSSGWHCVGMCGPLVMLLRSQKGNGDLLKSMTAYSLGKTLTYTFLGFVAGFMGLWISNFGLLPYIALILGIILVLSFQFPGLMKIFEPKLPFLRSIKSSFKNQLEKRGVASRFFTGVLNGFLPCGMVYLALSASILAPGPAGSAFYMLLFGLATLPWLWIFRLSGDRLLDKLKRPFPNLEKYARLALALLFIINALNISIQNGKISSKLVDDIQSEITVCH